MSENSMTEVGEFLAVLVEYTAELLNNTLDNELFGLLALLDRQRQPIELTAEFGDGGSVPGIEHEVEIGILGPFDEQLYSAHPGDAGQRHRARGIRQGEQLDRHLAFTTQVQPFPARHQDDQVGATREQAGDQQAGRQDLLEIVERQQQVAVVQCLVEPVDQVPVSTFLDSQLRRDRRGNQGRFAYGREFDRGEAIWKAIAGLQFHDGGEGQPRLADAARPGPQGPAPGPRPAGERFPGGETCAVHARGHSPRAC